MATKFCTNCGAENDSTARFCIYCRAPFAEPQPAAPAPPAAQAPPAAPAPPAAQAPPQPPPPAHVAQSTQQFPPPQGQQQGYQPQQPYGQAGQQQPYGQQQPAYQAQEPAKKKRGPLRIILIIVAVLILGCIGTFVAIFGAGSCTLGNIAEADYYEIGGDKVPSIKLALGEKYDVTGYATEIKNGQETQDIIYASKGKPTDTLQEYASYLNDKGWLRIQDADFGQASNPKADVRGFQLAKNSTTTGYVVVVTLYWETDSFNLVIDRTQGDVASETEPPAEVAEGAEISLGGTTNGGAQGGGGIGEDAPVVTDTGTAGDLLSTLYMQIFDARKYHMQVITYTYDNLDGTVMEYWINGNALAVTFEQEGESLRLIMKDGKQYVVMEDSQVVMVIDSTDSIDDMTFDPSSRQTFIGSGDGKFYGGDYYYEAFEDTVDGSQSLYFFDKAAGLFMGVRQIVGEDNVTDMVFLALDANIPSSVFEVPSNYQVIE